MLNQIFVTLLLLVFATSIKAQSFDSDYKAKSSGNIVQDKNFLSAYGNTTRYQIVGIAGEASIFANYIFSKKKALNSLGVLGGDVKQQLAALRFTEVELENILSISELPDWEKAMQIELIPSGYFIRHEGKSNKEFIRSILQDALKGINQIIDTYGLGIKGRYPAIDSASYVTGSADYHKILLKALHEGRPAGNLFFEPSLKAALTLLVVNKRDEAARFEPLAFGENQKAVDKISKTNWSRYPYAAIIVPGNGPAGTERLSINGKTRLKLAAERYDRELAPVIIVSGGNVHPFQTPYNEALEMKKELIRTYNIPESDIIIEPHARHTTTNIRNANRLIYRYGFPIGKKVLIVTDKKQAAKIADPEFVNRCREEMGHVPFLGLFAISDTEIEYNPVRYSLFMDNIDPLDP